MSRVYNFIAGPAVLPVEVLEHTRDEMLVWNGSALSATEMGQRGNAFVSIRERSDADLPGRMAVPPN